MISDVMSWQILELRKKNIKSLTPLELVWEDSFWGPFPWISLLSLLLGATFHFTSLIPLLFSCPSSPNVTLDLYCVTFTWICCALNTHESFSISFRNFIWCFHVPPFQFSSIQQLFPDGQLQRPLEKALGGHKVKGNKCRPCIQWTFMDNK